MSCWVWKSVRYGWPAMVIIRQGLRVDGKIIERRVIQIRVAAL